MKTGSKTIGTINTIDYVGGGKGPVRRVPFEGITYWVVWMFKVEYKRVIKVKLVVVLVNYSWWCKLELLVDLVLEFQLVL